MYKLLYNSNNILRLADSAAIPPDPANSDYIAYLAWVAAGNTAQAADVPTAAQVAHQVEITEAPGIARTWFAGQQAAIDFVRQTPAAQATQIDGMTLVQLKVVVKYLAIAVSMMIKERLLD